MASVSKCPLRLIVKNKNENLMGSVSIETSLTQQIK